MNLSSGLYSKELGLINQLLAPRSGEMARGKLYSCSQGPERHGLMVITRSNMKKDLNQVTS